MKHLFSTATACAFVSLTLTAASAPVHAAKTSPVGYWKSIDDDGKTEKSIIKVYAKGDKLFGKIVHLLNPSEPNPVCDECKGARKDKPITGMVILWDLEKDDDEWAGGRILDPENGKDYSCYISLEEGGKKLKVRGYMGFSLLGRTQYWLASGPPPAPKAAAPAPAPAPTAAPAGETAK